jgi:hypothetical protein
MNREKQILLTLWIFIWSLPLTIFGLLTSVVLLICGIKPIKWGPATRYEFGSNWGGIEFGGCFYATDKNPSYQTKCHELGHLLQQAYFGPLSPFVISMPSAARYWLREMNSIKKKYIYSIILTLIGCLLFLIPVVCGFVFSITWLWIIGLMLILYIIVLGAWLIFIETPKYKPGKPYVKYDDFWVEGDATRRGTAFMDKYYPNIK